MSQQSRSFTSRYPGLSNVLVNEVIILNELDKSKKVKVPAIWDTGATNSCITAVKAKELGLIPIGLTRVSTPAGIFTTNVYVVDIILPCNVKFDNLQVTEATLTTGDVLIGMDIIGRGDFTVSNFKGKTTFSFRVPSMSETDYVKNIHGIQAKSNKIGRNSPCPCGSEKKYKNCCGK